MSRPVRGGDLSKQRDHFVQQLNMMAHTASIAGVTRKAYHSLNSPLVLVRLDHVA